MEMPPVKPEIRKAYVRHDGELLFGTFYAAPRSFLEVPRDRGSHVRSPLAVLEPAWMTFEEAQKVNLPGGWSWRQENYWKGTGGGLGMFFARWFEVEHGLKFKHPHGGRMPKEIFWLLSGSMQTGEGWNYRNFQKYRRLEGLRFLPFLLDHDCFRFFVFRPTPERVEMAIQTFKDVISILNNSEVSLERKVRGVLRNVRIDELNDPGQLNVHKWIWPKGRPNRPLGFVYRDLKGPQDAVRFPPD